MNLSAVNRACHAGLFQCAHKRAQRKSSGVAQRQSAGPHAAGGRGFEIRHRNQFTGCAPERREALQATPVRFDTEAVHQLRGFPRGGELAFQAMRAGFDSLNPLQLSPCSLMNELSPASRRGLSFRGTSVGKKTAPLHENQRPMPPQGFGEEIGGPVIAPAAGLRDWIIQTFIEEDGRLFNPEHQHLLWAPFECLWAASTFPRQGRTVLGLTEEVIFKVSGWPRWRQEQQLREWFGSPEPAYLITFAADFCREASDADFCALVEHELYHIGHKKDEFGSPAFTKEGMPKLFIRGHDVEEFVGVVERYGVGDPQGALARLVAAAAKQPTVSRLDLRAACGTCLQAVA